MKKKTSPQKSKKQKSNNQKRKTQKRKKGTSRKKNNLKVELKRALFGFIVLVLLVIIAGVLLYYLVLRQPEIPFPQPQTSIVKPPPFEIYPKKILPPPPPATKPVLPPEILPNVAIVIDDLGYQKKIDSQFLDLDPNFTLSILPYSPYQNVIAQTAHKKGLEIMLHLPMEPSEYPSVNPGPGTLLTSMTPDQLIGQLKSDLACIPYIMGVNNHMGSRMTTNSSQMYQIFTVLKSKGLFFIDSRTTADSLSRPSARLFRVPFAERDIFIDHIQKPDFIRKQIALLIKTAQENGKAIGIAHPHQITYNILVDSLPELKQKVNLVPASELVDLVQ